MEAQDVPPNANDDILPTSIMGIIDVLAKRGCLDITSLINSAASGDRPCAGGGSCDVYRGVLHDGTKIAIKSLRVYESSPIEGDSEGQKVLKSAAKEIYHWSRLKHDNVVPLMGLAVFKGFISMISVWMDNGDLTSYIKRKPDADRVKLCMDICAGLCYIHTQGMVHGDLKGANVMISSDGVAMITDFGSAQLRDLTIRFSNNTMNGAFSIRWAAPELLVEGGPRGSMEADVYAYGMTVIEALTGKVPYHWASEAQVLTLVLLNKKLPSRPDMTISDDLWALLHSCWAQTPSERPKATGIGDRLKALIALPAIEKVIVDLTKYGCQDLTSSVDFNAFSDRPSARGEFSDVYQKKLHDGQKLAIKSLRVYESSPVEGHSQGQKVLKRAARELHLWSRLKHDNVLPLMGLAVFKGNLSMISAWMENGDLVSFLKQKPDADRIKLCKDICMGLSYIHTSGMIHGGLKGANIMVSSNEVAMIAGFGDAQLRDPTGTPLEFIDTTRRSPSIRWAAPELLEDGGPQGTMEADVYAYGMTVLEALTGKVPYSSTDDLQVPNLVLVKRIIPTRPDTGISDSLWEILNSCWDRVPSKRPKIASVRDSLDAQFPPTSPKGAIADAKAPDDQPPPTPPKDAIADAKAPDDQPPPVPPKDSIADAKAPNA